MVQRLRISVSASALTAVLLLAFTAAAQSRPAADETYTYSISAEGIPLETLVHHAEQATGKSFVYSEQSGLKGKKVLMIGTARVPRAEAFSLFQGIFVSQGYALIPFDANPWPWDRRLDECNLAVHRTLDHHLRAQLEWRKLGERLWREVLLRAHHPWRRISHRRSRNDRGSLPMAHRRRRSAPRAAARTRHGPCPRHRPGH